jgi:hypothetical protein
MSVEGISHISEIIDGWQDPPWVVDHPVAVAGDSGAARAVATSRDQQGWRVVVAGALVAALGAALFLAGRSSGEVAAPAAIAIATTAGETGAASGLEEVGFAEALVADAQRALDAWGRFAVLGDVAIVEPWFAADGPQLAQLRSESEATAAVRLGGAPYEFELTEPVLVEAEAGAHVIRSAVTVSRPGEIVQRYEWDIEMRRSAETDRWQLWTVKTAD